MKKYLIIFYDGFNQRLFEFYAEEKFEAINSLYTMLARDGFKVNNISKILTFQEYETKEK